MTGTWTTREARGAPSAPPRKAPHERACWRSAPTWKSGGPPHCAAACAKPRTPSRRSTRATIRLDRSSGIVCQHPGAALESDFEHVCPRDAEGLSTKEVVLTHLRGSWSPFLVQHLHNRIKR